MEPANPPKHHAAMETIVIIQGEASPRRSQVMPAPPWPAGHHVAGGGVMSRGATLTRPDPDACDATGAEGMLLGTPQPLPLTQMSTEPDF